MHTTQDKESLQKELQVMKEAALRIVKDHPELYHKMGLVFNSSSPSPPAGDQAGGKGDLHRKEEEAVGEEALLSDEVLDTLARDLSEYEIGGEEGGREGRGGGSLLRH